MALTKTQRIGGAVGLATLLAIPAEGLRQYAYNDPAGILTVCYGHTGRVEHREYTLDECKALLNGDMRQAVTIVEDCWPRRLPVKMLAALGDAVYNLGPHIVCDTDNSTLARKIRDWDFHGACRELPKWNKARIAGVLTPLPGLTKRREKEMELCLEGANDGPHSN